jgi:micrococcal nuclease
MGDFRRMAARARKSAPRKKSLTSARGRGRSAPRWQRWALGIALSLFLVVVATGISWYQNPNQSLGEAVQTGRALLESSGKPPAAPAATPSGAPVSLEVARVLRVIDGDTIVVSTGNGSEERVRLLRVDTPESVHRDPSRNLPIGKAAAAYVADRLTDRQVRLEAGREATDRFGRRLAYVIVEGENFNVELVRQGWSPYYTKYGRSSRYDGDFRRAEALARANKAGIWGDADYLASMDRLSED